MNRPIKSLEAGLDFLKKKSTSWQGGTRKRYRLKLKTLRWGTKLVQKKLHNISHPLSYITRRVARAALRRSFGRALVIGLRKGVKLGTTRLFTNLAPAKTMTGMLSKIYGRR